MVKAEKKIRKFRITQGMDQMMAISHELMIRRIVYEIKTTTIKGITYPELVTRDELTDVARNEIVKEAKKAMAK